MKKLCQNFQKPLINLSNELLKILDPLTARIFHCFIILFNIRGQSITQRSMGHSAPRYPNHDTEL